MPQPKVTLDSGQAVPTRAVRAREMLRLRLQRTREAHANGFPGFTDVVDTLPLRTSPAEMVARCRDMDIALCERGQDDRAVAGLRREVLSEQAALRRIWPQQGTCCLSGMLGGGLGVIVGGALGLVVVQPVIYGDPVFWDCGGGPVGAVVGCAVGSAVGVAIDLADNGLILARHRDHVNDLVRRVNRAVSSQP